MFRAIVAKELRQQQTVVVAGIIVSALVGLGLLLAARGAFRSGSIAPADAFREVFPMALLFVLWPLWGVLAAIQAFASDRAAGTEAFLLERPVPPRRLFLARLLAAAIGVLEFALGSLLVLWLFAGPVAAVALLPASEHLRLLAWAGLPAALAALVSGLLAAALGLPPLAAILAGAILLLVAGLAGFAILARLPFLVLSVAWFALWPAAALVLGYFASAWRMLTRGEPAGRGRLARGAVTLAAVAAAAAAVFVATAPALIRAGTPTNGGWFYRLPPVANGAAAIEMENAVRLVDTRTARILRFVPPPSRMLGWSPDGRVLAVATQATWLGGIGDDAQILWLDPAGRDIARPTRFPYSHELWFSVEGAWGRDELFVRDGTRRLFEVRPGDAAPRLVDELGAQDFFGGVTFDGTLLLWSRRTPPGTPGADQRFDLVRMDPDTGARARETSASGDWYAFTAGLSGDGRFTVLPVAERAEEVRLRDLERHEDLVIRVPGAKLTRPLWHGSRLFVRDARRNATRLYEIVPRNGPRLMGEWAAGASLSVSPLGDSALVFDDGDRPTYLRRFADGRDIELSAPSGDRADADWREWGWAAPGTLYFDGEQALYLVDARDPATAPRLPIR
jgi:hypothetical protein